MPAEAVQEREFFVVANSGAAPFFSDTTKGFVGGLTAVLALEAFKEEYSHPCGLYSAGIWLDANAYEKETEPLATYLSEKAKKAELLRQGEPAHD